MCLEDSQLERVILSDLYFPAVGEKAVTIGAFA